ncbi:MAG TPA: hypothetical protein EYN66_01655 [Myxococcales bacterium]|nr:hypothetical protein [Myxococcales bacterium]
MANFNMGVREGAYADWHANGQQWAKGAFKVVTADDGERSSVEDGVCESMLNSGKKSSNVNFKVGKLAVYGRDGKLLVSATRTRAGKWYDAEQAVFVETAFRDGKIHGNLTLIRDGGKKTAQTAFKKGERDGVHKEWHSTGSLALLGNYKKGVSHGKWVAWDRYGKLLTVTCLNAGKRVWMTFEPANPKVSCP